MDASDCAGNVPGTRRFDDFLRLTGMSSHLLSLRLKKLEAQGLIRREPYSERPLRHEYCLTEKGRDLWTIIIALKQWGDRWLGARIRPCRSFTRPAAKSPNHK